MIYLLPHLIEQTAARYPDKEAFRCRGVGLTYAGLVQRANQLAHTLIEQGVRRRDRVGIYLHKSLESAIAIYGIVKAGAAYVPLDPLAPAARIGYVLRDCGIRHLITQDAKRRELQVIAANCSDLRCLIGVDEPGDLSVTALSWDSVRSAPDSAPRVVAMEHDLAYIMYTSGSTGDPKGMMHTHYSGLSYARMSAALYGVTAADRLSNHSPLHFDMSTFDYFSGPLAGATTVIIPEEYSKLPASLSKLIEDERLTIWYSVPFALIQLLLRGVLATRDLSSLRWVLYGGEPFPPKHLRALMQALPQARFGNVYGPAEVNQCTYYHVPPEYATATVGETTPIGVDCANVESLVVDDADQPVESGAPGELLIRAPTMMRGYWGRPDLTERAFYKRHPLADQANPGYVDVFYRTGDLVQTLPDGNYFFLGRKDRQVKVRGYRVELDEIEAALCAHAQVEEAGVYTVPDDAGSHRIEAAVTVANGAAVEMATLTQHVADRLPSYAVPGRIRIVDDFPRTTSGKINRRMLQAHAREQEQ